MAFCCRQGWWSASVHLSSQTSGLEPESLHWLYSFQRIFSNIPGSGLALATTLDTDVAIGILQATKERKHSWSSSKLKETGLSHVIGGLRVNQQYCQEPTSFLLSIWPSRTLRPVLLVVQPSALHASWVCLVLELLLEALSKEQKEPAPELTANLPCES